ncbi:MAG: ribonuclease P protein component [Candidatus Portnoybacteria bacterium]|nr:ribonuclease P protein component [Candidatus Portnoybacteria bacterium]
MLPRKYKLKKDNDFKKVFNKGKYYQKDFIKIKFLENDLEINRFGLVIGLKISKKAVQRNKIKRQLEEVIQSELEQMKKGIDIIILVQPEIIEKEYQEIKETLIELFKKSKIIV